MEENNKTTQTSIFLRKSSGLVRAAGLWDVFIYNVGLISVGIGVAYTQRFGPAYYPDSSIPTATILAAFLMMLVVPAFWAWTTTIPRSGGIYVFLTRAQHPGFGFALSFVECISWLFYVAIAATLVNTVGIVPLVALFSGPESIYVQWFSSQLGKLVIATFVIWLAVFLLIRGTRTYLKVQKILFVLAVIGTIALLMAIGSEGAASTFRMNFNHLFAGFGDIPYSEVITQARRLGWENGTTHSLGASVALSVWPFLPLIGAAFSIGIGGEIRNSSRNQFLGMMGSLLFCTVLFILIAVLGDKAIGTDFQGAIAYIFDNGNSGSIPISIPFAPYFSYLAGLATDSVVLRVLIPLGFLCWVWFWIPGVLIYTGRAFLAWSLDRAAPSQLAALHSRLATPYISVITGAFVAQIFLILTLYTNFFATLVFILAATVAWCITLIFGVLFPFTAPKIFSESPIAGKSFFGIPLMSILCAIGVCALGFVIYLLWNDSIAAGHSPNSLIAIGITFGAGAVFYLIMRALRKRQGIDISRAYKEIPVE